jgi:hypothetical protein
MGQAGSKPARPPAARKEWSRMKRVVDLFLTGLMLAGAASAGDAACGVRKGLYNEWLELSKIPKGPRPRNESSAYAANRAGGDSAKQAAIVKDYQAFFQRLSKAAAQDGDEALQPCCADDAADPLALLACRGAIYLKSQRAANKEFLDGIPTGRRGAQMIWDLEAIAADQAYRLIDELFVLVLDGRDAAASKYFNLLSAATPTGERHMDDQIKILMRESPAVVVKEWPVLRRYQPKLKQLLSEMVAQLPEAELQKMRKELVGFCDADNLDCPEILKIFGRPAQ